MGIGNDEVGSFIFEIIEFLNISQMRIELVLIEYVNEMHSDATKSIKNFYELSISQFRNFETKFEMNLKMRDNNCSLARK